MPLVCVLLRRLNSQRSAKGSSNICVRAGAPRHAAVRMRGEKVGGGGECLHVAKFGHFGAAERPSVVSCPRQSASTFDLRRGPTDGRRAWRNDQQGCSNLSQIGSESFSCRRVLAECHASKSAANCPTELVAAARGGGAGPSTILRNSGGGGGGGGRVPRRLPRTPVP
jgi:hypothetical protein